MDYPNINTAKMAELVEFYNAHVEEGQQVKKFKDKATAQVAVQGVIARLEGTTNEELEEDVAEVVADSATSLLGQLTALGSASSGGGKASSKNEGVWLNAKMLFDKGLGNKEVLSELHEMYGNTNTTYACVAWYRNKYNKSGDKFAAENQVKVDKVLAFAAKHGLTDGAITDLAKLLGCTLRREEDQEKAEG